LRKGPFVNIEAGHFAMLGLGVNNPWLPAHSLRQHHNIRGEQRYTASDACRLLLVRVAAEKALPFEPLNPNAETVAAIKAARRGELVKVGKPGQTAAQSECERLNTQPAFSVTTARKSGQHGKRLAAETPLPPRNLDHPLSAEWNDHRDRHIRPDLIASTATRPPKEADAQSPFCPTPPAKPPSDPSP
jgi:hypothetical protein